MSFHLRSSFTKGVLPKITAGDLRFAFCTAVDMTGYALERTVAYVGSLPERLRAHIEMAETSQEAFQNGLTQLGIARAEQMTTRQIVAALSPSGRAPR